MKRVLILCTGNSCRSQMAEGLWRQVGGAAWEVHSAGSQPAGYVHPLAIRAMREIGVDVGAARSKHVAEFAGQAFDLVLTVCDNARETCPAPPSARQVMHWSLPDPAATAGADDERMPAFRAVRDDLSGRIRKLLEQLA
ncbi:MAG: arsenate reductase ArsC [Planctomycetota bacterium]